MIRKLLLIILIMPIFLSGCVKQKELTNNQLHLSSNEIYFKNYSGVLDKYKNFVEDYYNKEELLPKYEDDPWGTMLTTVMSSAKPSDHGYAFKNLSENGVPELLLITKQEDNDYFINAIYSFVDSQPKLLETYWYRSRCSLNTDGFVYVRGSNSAFNSVYLKRKIKPDGTDIETIYEVEINSNDKGEMLYYFTDKNGEKTEITKQEFEEKLNQMPQDNKQSDLDFISI